MQPMQNRCKTARLADLVVAPSTSLSSTANHVSIPITGAPTDQRTAHCKEENKGKEKREECDLQLIRPASRHCALIVHSRCILVTFCVILCVFTQLILSHFDLEGNAECKIDENFTIHINFYNLKEKSARTYINGP